MSSSRAPVLELRNVSCSYGRGDSRLDVFENLNLKIEKGTSSALVGPSGCGKSSLLHIMGLLDRPTSGEVFIDGEPASALSDNKLSQVRRHKLGFVFQFHHLLPEFDAVDNIALPALIAGEKKSTARARARELLAQMGLSEREKHRPAQLSGGERQRVAIARALMNRPKLLFADEPTGNLDPDTAKQVFTSLLDLVDSSSSDSYAIIIATHNMELAQMLDRRLDLTAGSLQ